MLDRRLGAVASFVRRGRKIIDVGTDHALLPAFLIKQGIIPSAYGTDIRDGPLKSAKKTALQYGIEEELKLIRADGLHGVPTDADDIVIAGMGASLISRIVLDAHWLKLPGKRLILQPMHRADILRKNLYNNGFAIDKEIAVIDGEYVYCVMCVAYTGECVDVDDYFAYTGKMVDTLNQGGEDSHNAALYLLFHAKKIRGKAWGLARSTNNDKRAQSQYWEDISRRIIDLVGVREININDVYKKIDEIAPFSYAEKGDNSGLLVGNGMNEVTRILLALDITNDVIDEAAAKGCELIISHHPVIFHPLYSVNEDNPVYRLIKHGIAAICAHTNIDMTSGGLCDLMADAMGVRSGEVVKVMTYDGDVPIGYGRICELEKEYSADELAQRVKEAFGNTVIRYVDGGKPIRRIVLSSGAGWSIIDSAHEKGFDAFITGDCKHDQLVDAVNKQYTLIDAGHFHTETIFAPMLRRELLDAFPAVDVIIANSNVDPVKYL
ncbi:MAG: Nif3-like dinuclear metal center hexameric protein [Clostridiales bacterium]|nr:Nif3-like dinuclear metal center hexameric protein [Clostridiales bacterium]